jgi:PAS domain S-box-containing protein
MADCIEQPERSCKELSVLKDDTVAETKSPGSEQEAARLEAMEASLRRQERELAEAYRIARLGTWRWSVDSGEVVWSEEVYHAFGLTPEEPAPEYAVIRALHTPQSAARLEELVGRAVSHGESYTHDMELLLPDGTGRWIASRGEVGARAADGRVTELRGTIQDITERKRTEMALLRRERELVEAQRIGRLGTFRWLKQDGKVMWSEAVYRMFGVDPAEPVPRGETLAALMTPESWDRISKATYAALEDGVPYSMDLELVDRNGAGRRWVTVRGEGLKGADGEVVELAGTVQDVTDRRRVEEALRESQSRFQKLYDSDLVGIGFPDASGAIHEANDAMLRIVGYTRDDLEAGLVRWDTMTPPEYRELDMLHIAEAAERGSCTPYEKEYIRKDGTRVPILCGFARLGGERLGAIGFVMDLSAQKAAERKVRERELQFRELAESLPQLVWASDTKGDRVYTNRRYTEYTGFSEEGLMGGRWRELLHPDDLERTNRLWAHSMATGEPYQNEYRIRRHDGVYRSFLVRGVAMRNAEGAIERWLGSATDIHDQKLAEEAVRRTEKLAAAGRLAATIAHEINNPLAAVTNALYLALMDDGLKAETRTYLNMAEQELARAAHVTAQTLQFHRQTSTPGEANVAEIVESAMGLFATRFRSSGVAVQREYAVERRLYCCADELRQVFANLLSNALDAMRHGGRLRIRMREDVAGVRVMLADTGSGISPEVLGRIFEPFLSTKEATGTGLGLWVSEGIVRKHQGTIRVKSKTGVGTVFVVALPWDGVER